MKKWFMVLACSIELWTSVGGKLCQRAQELFEAIYLYRGKLVVVFHNDTPGP